MRWQFVVLALCLLTGHWFIAVLLASYIAYRWLQFSPQSAPITEEHRASRFLSSTPPLPAEITDLLILRLDLGRQLADGTITKEFYYHAVAQIDTLGTETLGRLAIAPKTYRWRIGKENAWRLLIQRGLLPQSPPPWQSVRHDDGVQGHQPSQQLALPLPSRSPSPLDQRNASQETRVSTPLHTQRSPLVQPLPVETAALLEKTVSVPPLSHPPLTPSPSLSPPSYAEDRPQPRESYEWKPTTPTALERALQAVSGWPALIIPFLVQNILWFIGGLCFIAGSIFLVSSTTGFAKGLVVSAVLLIYTLAILWAGYQLRRRQPNLITASSGLLILGVLLLPLNVAASVRLLNSASSPFALLASVCVTGVVLWGLYHATTLVSGIMERTLQGRHPQVFWGLTLFQLAVPLLTRFPSWPLLAVFHLCLLGVLAYGLVTFVQGWFHDIFVECRTIAYYAAGSLVYTALVSFAHLTWGYQPLPELPSGYYGPLLMVVCALLFFVDAQLKQWSTQVAFLSRISFALYGFSVLALLLSVHAPSARVFTLLLASSLYGSIAWYYQTRVPLLLLLTCVGWLYGDVILRHVPVQWYFFASLPGLVSVWTLSHWLQNRQSIALALVGYRISLATAATLTGWSLLHAQPGWVAMSTALTLTACLLYGLRFVLPQTTNNLPTISPKIGLPNSPWAYSVTLMGGVTAAYAPLWLGLGWTTQYAFALVLLASLWSAASLRNVQKASPQATAVSEILLNSALLSLSLACVLTVSLAVPDLTANRAVPMLFALMGGVFLWLSLALCQQGLFYCVLGLWGTAGAIFKLTYFPAPGTGMIEMLLALSVWALGWWLDTQSAKREDSRPEPEESHPVLTLLWQFSTSGSITITEIVRAPLRQTMAALWFLGMIHLVMRLSVDQFGWAWITSAALGAIGAVLGSGSFAIPSLLSVAVVLGAGAWEATIFQVGVSDLAGLSLAGAVYALVVWQLSVSLFSHPAVARLMTTLHFRGNRTVAERYVHWTTFALTLWCILIPLGSYGLFTPSVSFLATLLTSILFLGLSGWRSQQQWQSYLLLGLIVLITLLCSTWSVFLHYRPAAFQLFYDSGLGLLAVTLGFVFWTVAQLLSHWTRTRTTEQATSAHNLYHESLSIMALILAFLAGNQQLNLALFHLSPPTLLLSGVLFLAGIAIVLANHSLGHALLNVIGLLFVIFGGLWAETWYLHRNATVTLWPMDFAFIDHWLMLAIVALGLATTALILERQREVRVEKQTPWALFFAIAEQPAPASLQHLYIRPLRLVAMLVYGWALGGTFSLSVFASTPVPLSLPGVFLVLTLVAFLLFHRSGWLGFPWLAGFTALSLGLALTTFCYRLAFPQFPVIDDPWNASFAIVPHLANLLWVNILLGSIAWWQRQGTKWATQWGWSQHEIIRPLLFWPSTFLLIILLVTFGNEAVWLRWGLETSQASRPLLETGMLLLSFLHLWWIRKTRWTSHAVLTSWLCLTLAVWLTSLSTLFHSPLLLTLWSATLLLAHAVWCRHQQRLAAMQTLGEAVLYWIAPSLLVTFAILALVPDVTFVERMLTLTLLAALAGTFGWQRQERSWLVTAFVMFLLLLHGWPPLWVPFSQALLLLPWYSLLIAGVSWLSLWAYDMVSQQTTRDSSDPLRLDNPPLTLLAALLSEAWRVLITLAVIEWGVHAGFLYYSLLTIGPPQWFIGTSDAFAALGAATLLFAFGIHQVRHTKHAAWLYAVLIFAGAAGLYLRLLVVGLAPASVWDTTVLMVITYGMFALYRWTQGSEPVLYAVMVLPLFTLLTVPLQLASSHASLTFLTASVLYFLVYAETNRSLPLYLAFVAFNAAVYLWIPGWASDYDVVQMYVIPATLSVLVLLHLHREDVPSHILNSARLAATSVLYACATYDVFQQESLVVFATMIALGLTGIFVGIVLRTRAFLYSGTAFLVLNVFGQLLVHIPEHKLGRAIILLSLGAALTGISVWFSWQREQILQRIRIFRADLETWA